MPVLSHSHLTERLSISTVAVLLAMGGWGRPLSGQEQRVEAPRPEEEQVGEALQSLAETLGIRVTWQGGPQEIEYDWGRRSWEDAATGEVRAYTPILVEELGLFPSSLLQRAEVKEIILCRNLRVEMEGVEEEVSGHLDYGTGTLWVSVAFTDKVNDVPKQRRVIHHALFHQLDYVMGTVAEDPEWEALNPEGFFYGFYGPGGIHDRTRASGLLSEEYPGFLNRYSTGHIADDKAEIFAYLMVLHHYVQDRGERDPVIKAKIETMKRRLEAFDPGMNAGFWDKIATRRRDATPYIKG